LVRAALEELRKSYRAVAEDEWSSTATASDHQSTTLPRQA